MTIQEAKNKVVSLARSEVGYKEGANNYNKFASDPNITKLYGFNVQYQPWCCVFVNWVFIHALGYDLGTRVTYGGTASCNNSAQLYKNNGAWSNFPQIGDQAFFYSGGINHTGIVVSVEGTAFNTVEGNYSDKVSLVHHNTGKSDVAGFGRPNWKLAENATEKPKEEPKENHSWTPPTLRQSSVFKPDVVVLQALLNVKDFPCGTADGEFGPKTAAAVARAQHFYGLNADCICGPLTWKKLLETG